MELVVHAVFVDSMGQRVLDFVFQSGFVDNCKVVRSERQIPPHEQPMRTMERHHPTQDIMLRTNLESFSSDIYTECTNGRHHRQEFELCFRVPLLCARGFFGPET